MHDIYPKRCYWSGKKQEDRFGPPPSTQEILGTRTPLRADSTYDTPIRIYERFPLFVARMKLTLKPVIREMVRTGVIVPKVTLLVDKIIIVQLSTSADSSSVIAYRMYLTDGDKSIQAVFKRRMHKQIVDLEIQEGSYIALSDYRLDTAPRLNGNGKVMYIAISDFQWMGEERRYELQNAEHEVFGSFKQRPEAAHLKLLHPDTETTHVDLPSEASQVNENWNCRYNHVHDQNGQYRVACSRFADPSAEDEVADIVYDFDEETAEDLVRSPQGTPVDNAVNSPGNPGLTREQDSQKILSITSKLAVESVSFKGTENEKKRKRDSSESENSQGRQIKMQALDRCSGNEDPSTETTKDEDGSHNDTATGTIEEEHVRNDDPSTDMIKDESSHNEGPSTVTLENEPSRTGSPSANTTKDEPHRKNDSLIDTIKDEPHRQDDPPTDTIEDERLPIPPETSNHMSWAARLSRLDRNAGQIRLGSLVKTEEIIYDPDTGYSIIEADRQMVENDSRLSHNRQYGVQSKWLLRLKFKSIALLENGITLSDVFYDILFSREDFYVVKSNDEDDDPHSSLVIRVRLIVEPKSRVDNRETMVRLRNFLRTKTIPKGRPLPAQSSESGDGIAEETLCSKKKDQHTDDTDRTGESPGKGANSEPGPILSQAFSLWAIKAAMAGRPLQPIDTPLKLSDLVSVTGCNRSRNKVVDVLAMVDSVDDFTVKRTNMPLKRDIRIMDASTEKKVTLSIFANPIDCIPTVGDVVLFRNVVTHDFKGGNLNAYPKQCDGKDWCIPNPLSSPGKNLSLEETRSKILADAENGKKLKASLQEMKLHADYSLKWPKQFQARQLRNTENPDDVKDIKMMQKWGLVHDPPVCDDCGEPHKESPHEEAGCMTRRYPVWDEGRCCSCRRHGRLLEEDSE